MNRPTPRLDPPTRLCARAGALASLLLAGCQELPVLTPEVCGNGVLEPHRGEDCDMSEDPALGPDTRCADVTDPVRACRYVCSRTDVNAPKCPTAWACGDDGTCHFASGTYVESDESPLSLPSYSVLDLADLDGDENEDIVTSSGGGIFVKYAKRDGSFSTSYEFPLRQLPRTIAFGKLDEGLSTDIVAATPAGPVVLRGQRNRTFEPQIFPQIASGDRLLAEAGNVYTVLVAGIEAEPRCGEGARVALAAAYEDNLVLSFPAANLERSIPEYTGWQSIPSRLLVRDLDGDGGEELIVALPGARVARAYGVTCGALPQAVELPELALPGPIATLGLGSLDVPDPVLVADVDGNGLDDLLFAVEDRTLGRVVIRVAVAFALEQRGYAPAVFLPRFEVLRTEVFGYDGTLPSLGSVVSEWPLAAGDLDGDGVADYVTPNGIWLTDTSGPQPELVSLNANLRLSTWTGALVLDVSGDGLNDVVGVSDGSALGGFEIFTSRELAHVLEPAGTFPSQLVDTQGAPRILRPGDYDGDGVPDVAYVESGFFGGASLSVLYGGTLDRVGMGTTDAIMSAEQARFTDGDGAADLLLVTLGGTPDAPHMEVGLLFGTDQHRLVSPVPIFDTDPRPGETPFADDPPRLMVDNFLGADGRLDLLAYNRSVFLLAPGRGDASFATTSAEGALRFSFAELAPGFLGLEPDCIQFASANLDLGTPDSEVVMVADPSCIQLADPGGGEGSGSGDRDIGNLARLVIIGSAGGAPKVVSWDLPDTIGSVTSLQVAQLDGQGGPELVISHAGSLLAGEEPVVIGPGLPGREGPKHVTAGVAVLWNASIDLSSGPAPALHSDGRSDVFVAATTGAPRSVVAINADGDEPLELAILVHESGDGTTGSDKALIYLADFTDPTSFVVSPPVVDNPISPLGRAELVAHDLDHDGLQDLILGDGALVYIYRSIAHGQGGR